MSTTHKVALVTGANQGIGRAIVSSLLTSHTSHHPLTVFLAGRNPDSVSTTVSELQSELGPLGENQLKPLVLDITSTESIDSAAQVVRNEFGYLDILINNAGIATKGDAFDEDIARKTAATNYTGTFNVTTAFLPLIRQGGRIVNVSSSAGHLRILSPELQQKFSDPNVTFSQLDQLMEQFFQDIADGSFKQKGWPRTAYGVSKVGLTAQTRVFARTPVVKEKDILMVSCCPGWIRTNMSDPRAPGTVEEGARTPVWLATGKKEEILQGGDGENGGFYKNEKRIEW